MKQMISWLLTLTMVLGMMPGAVFAEDAGLPVEETPVVEDFDQNGELSLLGGTAVASDTGGDEGEPAEGHEGMIALTSDGNGWLMADGVVISNTGVPTADKNKLPAGDYYLAENITIGKTIKILDDVNICLNGKVLQYESTTAGSVFEVAGGALYLSDCGTGYHLYDISNTGLWVWNDDDGEELLYGGAITGGTGRDGEHGGAIYISKGSLEIHDINLVGNTAAYGGAISGANSYAHTIRIYDSHIVGNVASDDIDADGGAIYARSSNGQIYTNLFLSNTQIEENAAVDGGAIAGGGSITLENCTLRKNKASYLGGAIYVSGGSLNLTDCTITKNTAGRNGGAVHTMADMRLSGEVDIRNNICTAGDGAPNVYLNGANTMVVIDEDFSGNSYIHIKKTMPDNQAFTSGGEDYLSCFISDDPDYHITDSTGELLFEAHMEITVPGAEPTCTIPGLTEGKQCICGKVYVDQVSIPALGHEEEILPGTDATCTETGLTEGKKCSVCGEITAAQEPIPLADHVEEILPGTDATCTADGLTEGKKCSVCGQITVEQEVIPAEGHNWQATDDPGLQKCEICEESQRVYQASGTCGPNLTWTLSYDGVLTVSGTGDMHGYGFSYRPPWYDYRESILQVVLEEGVTGIASYAFEGCKQLTDVTLPETLTSSKDYAFSGCSVLENLYISDAGKWCAVSFANESANPLNYAGNFYVDGQLATNLVIPDGVVQIGNYAFYNCDTAETLSIPGSVRYIGKDAFLSCSKLSSVDIPEGVVSIGTHAFALGGYTSVTVPSTVTQLSNDAFANCSKLREIQVSPDNTAYSSVNGVLLNKEQTVLILAPCGYTGAFEIPETVVTVSDYAFYDCFGLTAITIPNSVTNLGKWTFHNCDSLVRVEIPESVTVLDEAVFDSCNKLESVIIPETVVSIGQLSFYHAESLPQVYLPASIKSVGEDAFLMCDSLIDVYYGGSETDRAAMSIDDGNEDFVDAIWHYLSQPTNGHRVVILPGKAATCTETGLTEGKQCAACGEVLEEQQVLPLADHTEGEAVVENKVAATCKAEGSYETVIYCSVCGEQVSRETVTLPLADHIEEILPGKAATSTEEGLTEGKKCTVCGTITVPQQTIPVNTDLNGDGYHDGDVAVFNAIIENNGLNWTKDDPASWKGITWSQESTKRCTHWNVPSNTLVGTLDVTGLTELTYLDCFENPITGLKVTGLVRLEQLFCDNTHITQLDATGLTSLRFLSCIGTELTELHITGLSNLAELWCYDTNLTGLDLSGLVNLKGLYCANTGITQLDLSNLPMMKNLSANNTPLHTIHVAAGYTVGTASYGTTLEFALPTPIREGYTFLGWYTAETGGEPVETGDAFEQATTLYARWQNNCSHSWGDAACTEKRTCTLCGEVEAEARGHTEELIPGKAATCTNMGRTDGKKCSVCDVILQAQQNIPALGHNWQATDDVFVEQCGTCKTTRTNTFNGTCGTGVTWTLTADGVLTISGSGSMKDYTDAQSAPWAAYADAIVSVVVEEGITGLGSNAFACCTALKTLTLPSGVDGGYMDGFTQCTLLETVTVNNHRDAFLFDATRFPTGMQVIFLQRSPALDIFAGGEGTEANPYLVATAAQLDAVREYLHAHYLQIADIDMTGVAWVPIGGMSAGNNGQFSGSYDGDGYKITNLTIESDLAAVGMFGYCMGATLKDITLEDLTVTVTDSEAALAFVGGLSGVMCGTVENCTVSGSITATVPMSGYFGGICAEAQSSTITGCTGGMTLTCSAGDDETYSYAGGITGFAQNSTIQNCTNTGAVTIRDNGLGVYAGGIAGHTNGAVTNCKNSGTIDATTPMYAHAGGIAASATGAVSRCANTGVVDGMGGSAGASVGGICGYGKEIQQCVNTGAVSASTTSEVCAGGIVARGYGTVKNCFNVGAVTASVEYDEEYALCYAGGIAGYLEGALDCVYSLGQLSATGDCTRYQGSLAAYRTDGASLSDAYYCNCSQLPYAGVGNTTGGTACTPAEMKTRSTYAGFDFTDVWSMDPDAAYPYPVLQKLSVTLPEVELGISGICGDNLTWTLDEQGTLTFSGSGEMYDYQYESQPWLDYLDQINKVVVEEGVTSVGAGAFWSASNYQLTGGLTLPSTLESIGDHAFQYCMGLGTVQIPDGVTSIGEWAFQTSGGLTAVTVGNGIRNIGAHAFDIDDEREQVTVSINAYVSQVTQGDEVFGDSVTVIFKICGVHSWGDAACTEKRTCTLCGEVEAEARGHKEETIPGTAATCTVDGLTDGKKCTVCGETTVAQKPITAEGHKEETIPGTAATCTVDGLTEGKKCTVCGETTVEQKPIPAEGHKEETIPGTPASCTSTGLTDGKKCSVCETVLLAQQSIEKLPHTEETIPGKAAGCTEIGLTEGRQCTVCGELVVMQTAIPATGHAWDNGTVNAQPTCTVNGVKTYVCIHDQTHTRTEVLPVREHNDGNADGQCDTCKLQLSCTVTFDVDGGKPAPQAQITSVGGYLTEPETPTRKNHGFRGWFRSDDDSRAWDFTRDVVEENMTLVAHWYKNKHQITGNIYQHNGGEPGRPIKLTLMLGSTVIYETQTNQNGFYEMADIPAGIYNLVVEDPDGGIKTVVVEVREDGKMKGINLPEHNVVSELIVPDEAGNEITVGGLDGVADDHHQGDTRVTVTMTAGKTEDITAEAPETDDKKAQKEAQKAIKEQAKTNNGNQPEDTVQEFVFLDIRIEKTEGDQVQEKEEITETSDLLEIRVPVETNGRRAFKVYRHHGEQVDELTEQPNGLGEYIEIHDGFVMIYAKRFSMYAVSSEVCAHEMSTRYSWSARGCDVIHECALCDDPLVETTETVQFWLEDGALRLSHLPEDLRLLVCGYNGGQLAGSQVLEAPQRSNPLAVEGDVIKLFLLQNDGSWKPLANAKTLK